MSLDSASPGERPSLRASREPDRVYSRIYCRVVILLTLYVLSTGPLYWPIYDAYASNGGLALLYYLYYPLVKLNEVGFVSEWFNWYIGLWLGL